MEIKFNHKRKYPMGFAIGCRVGKYMYGFWIGYGRPTWWKPRFFGPENAKFGFGFGWLLLCFQVQVFEV